jgi:hypothetical protein
MYPTPCNTAPKVHIPNNAPGAITITHAHPGHLNPNHLTKDKRFTTTNAVAPANINCITIPAARSPASNVPRSTSPASSFAIANPAKLDPTKNPQITNAHNQSVHR